MSILDMVATILKPFAYLIPPVLALRFLSDSDLLPSLVRYYLRIILYVSTMGVCSLWGVIVSIAMSLMGNRFNINFVVARSFYTLASRLLSIRFSVQGEHHLDTRPAVLVGNHQSMLDVLYLGRIFPRRAAIMAKRELKWMPGLGQYMALSGAVFVDRSNSKTAVQSLAEAGEKMKAQNTSLWLFPEGTRSMRESTDMLPFKKGAFHLAVQANLPIIPVVCENYWRIYRHGIFGTGALTIRVLPPISTTNLTGADVAELAERTRSIMLDALREISDARSADTPQPPTSRTMPAEPRGDASGSERRASPQVVVDVPIPSQPVGVPEPAEVVRKRTMSAISSTSRSDAGVETEEDEGMVLVGRP